MLSFFLQKKEVFSLHFEKVLYIICFLIFYTNYNRRLNVSWCTADWSALMLIAAGAIIALCLKNKTRLATFFALAALTGGVLTFGIYRIVLGVLVLAACLVLSIVHRSAWGIVSGIIYGISAFGLSQRLKITRGEAAELIDTYFKLYPAVRKFMDDSIAKARETGYAVTMLGRRRSLRDIKSRNATARMAAERDAINTPVQGTAADLIKLAMVRVSRALKEAGLKARMILQIHDELLFDVPKNEVEQVKEIAVREMTQAMKLEVPLEVSVGAGSNWLEAH
jgi:hypothetical protein